MRLGLGLGLWTCLGGLKVIWVGEEVHGGEMKNATSMSSDEYSDQSSDEQDDNQEGDDDLDEQGAQKFK